MDDLPEHLARLAPAERRERLKRLLEKQIREPACYPLSPGQRTLWFLHNIGGAGGSQNFPFALRTLAPIDVAVLRRSLQDLTGRHPILRTTYEWKAEEPLQRVSPRHEVALETVDATGWSDAELRDRVSDDAYREFDLETGPVFRTTVFLRSEQEQILLFVWHHIAMDGWSLCIALDELFKIYGARKQGLDPGLPPVPPYSAFVEWQKQQSGTEEWARHKDFWLANLGGDPPRLRLPADQSPSLDAANRAGHVVFEISETITAKLRDVARQRKATLFTVVLAAGQALLHHYSGQEEVLVRVPTAGRPSQRFAGTLGFFVNQVVIRGKVDAGMTFPSLLAQATQRTHEVLEHQDYPLPLLLADLPPKPEPGLSRFSGVMFILQKIPVARPKANISDWTQARSCLQSEDVAGDLGGVPLKSFPVEPRASGFELDFQILDRGDRLTGVVLYSRALFQQGTVQHWANHLRTILERIAADSSQRVSGLVALPPEAGRALQEWNKTERVFPRHSLVELFRAQAKSTPDAVAVREAENEISYQDLNDRSDRLAARIEQQVSKRESLAGIFLPGSIEAITAILAIRKAGLAYVPLDPSLPPSSVAAMLEDTQLPVVVTTSEFRDRLPATSASILLIGQDDSREPRPVGRQAFAASKEGDSPLYVLYTSGSAGEPKGIAGSETATLNRLHWMWERYPYQEGEVACLTSPLGFVDSVASIFGPLLKGVPLMVADHETLLDTDRLLDFLAANAVSRIVTVPSLLRALLERERPLGSRLPKLRYCVCSGETLPAALARRFLEEAPRATLLNLYGCSEAAGDSCCYEMRAGWDGDRVPIGRPIANTRIYILDEQEIPLPAGIPGEIHIAGKGLARRYWRRPDLTAERFVQRSLLGREERVYRTGDRGRYLHDGTIEYLGRWDRQLKIRGQRVEPSEVETVIATHPGVDQVLVTSWDKKNGDSTLAAYVVASPARAVTATELRVHAASLLADSKVPSAYVFLEQLPLTTNGKVDIEQLPDPSESLLRGSETVLPRNPVEEVVAALWCDVLGLASLGVHDHFFELGGHSLTAMRTISRLREMLRTEIPLRLIFLWPTVAGFSRALLELPERAKIERVAATVVEVARLPEDEVKARLPALRQDTG